MLLTYVNMSALNRVFEARPIPLKAVQVKPEDRILEAHGYAVAAGD